MARYSSAACGATPHNMDDLMQRKCSPCEGGTPPLTHKQIQEYIKQVSSDWQVVDDKMIQRIFKFKNFKSAMAFVNRIANLAEAEGHHPDIQIHYNKVVIEFWTHAIEGLSENDFIVAAKIEELD